MTFSWQLLGDCNLSLAGFKGVPAHQPEERQNALDPSCSSGSFSQERCQEKFAKVLEYTIFLTLPFLRPRFLTLGTASAGGGLA